MIISFLPGDLVEFEGDAGVYLITSVEKRAFSYFWSPSLDFELIERHQTGIVSLRPEIGYGKMPVDPQNSPKVLRIRRLFDFNLYHSAVCNEAICYPRQINGECSGCPLGWVSGNVRSLYLPGDEVYLIFGKRVKEIEQICLSFDSVRHPRGSFNIKGVDQSSWLCETYRRELCAYFNEWGDISIDRAWTLLSDSNYFTVCPRYYVEGDSSGRSEGNIRLRERGQNTYYKAEDVDTLCKICIYQGGDRCESCTVEKIKNHNICKI